MSMYSRARCVVPCTVHYLAYTFRVSRITVHSCPRKGEALSRSEHAVSEDFLEPLRYVYLWKSDEDSPDNTRADNLPLNTVSRNGGPLVTIWPLLACRDLIVKKTTMLKRKGERIAFYLLNFPCCYGFSKSVWCSVSSVLLSLSLSLWFDLPDSLLESRYWRISGGYATMDVPLS